MCEMEEALVSLSKILLIAASFCVYQAHTEKEVGQHSRIKSQGPREYEYKTYCLNGGECYYLIDEENLGCNCTWLYGGKRLKSTCGGTRLDFRTRKR